MREATIYSLLDQTKLHIHLPDGGKWVRSYLKEILGERAILDWFKDSNDTVWWEVSKTHREKLINALLTRYQGVWVVQDYRTAQACTGSCRRAKTTDCECSCGGQFHGGTPTNNVIANDVLISSEVRRIARYYPGI